MDTTATFRQALYNAGIGISLLRGNHEDAASKAAEFMRVFSQIQSGINNIAPVIKNTFLLTGLSSGKI